LNKSAKNYDILFDTIKNVVEVKSMPTMLEIWTEEAIEKGKSQWEAKGQAKAGQNMVTVYFFWIALA